MRVSGLAAVAHIVAGVAVAWATDAPVIRNSPPAAYSLATMPEGGNKNVDALVSVITNPSGDGVEITININGGDKYEGGPFMYHIHDKAVPSDGNCTATLAHLDPYGRGETPPCDPSNPASCQVGDLSGKFGPCETLPGCTKTFVDPFLSLAPSDPAYLGNRSFVIHYANKTRIACANFNMGLKPTNSSNSTGSPGNSTQTQSGGGGLSTSTITNPSGAPKGPSATNSLAPAVSNAAMAGAANIGAVLMAAALAAL